MKLQRAWKTIKILIRNEGLPDCYSPKSCFKIAFKNKWIDDETTWLKMLDDKNIMSRTYDSEEAFKVYKSLPVYLEQFTLLVEKIKTLLKN